jgi:hypothetical protein
MMGRPMSPMAWSRRLWRVRAGVVPALLLVIVAACQPAYAASMGTASATPDTHLQSGAQISVSISGFPANATVAGVQCDQRGDNAGSGILQQQEPAVPHH